MPAWQPSFALAVVEHASMALEWIRRNDARFDKELREYLFTDGSITGREEEATGG